MKARPLARLPDVLVLEPTVFGDDRGFFYESFNERGFAELVGEHVSFVQDNHSRSAGGVLRGLHYQIEPHVQGKLVRVAAGAIYDVAVDVRSGSPTFGRWVAEELNSDNKLQMWIPAGFAHGFLVLSDHAEVLYKTTDYYAPECDRAIRWDDPEIGIPWPVTGTPLLSSKDATAGLLVEAEPLAVHAVTATTEGEPS